MVVCWKLVRDRIGEELSGREGVLVYRVSGEQLEALLRVKIVEEAIELAESGDVGEAVDLVEALLEWLRLKGHGLEYVLRSAEEKRRVRGGFSGGYVVVWPDRDSC
ncbi:nucleoside triphosphate pyrophosphohydrolase [Hyperthermus butylicus]|uniref:nucleoside triphosphate pyrophosphohydrolase n=1 Tax=Hyperthermus butylicus TaxID=54248 RepID=UPI00064E8009|nr:nucleoside triphosphate pyrophosphohydrolase [Hyperthermus butylicus]